MSRPSTSYTLRIPKDLRRLLEAEAARTECTLAATVVNMCWMGLEVRGGPEAVGSIPTAPIKPDMQTLRDICAGKIDVPPDGFSVGDRNIDFPPPSCIVCDSPMREVKGKWACQDVSCGKYGVEQKPRW